ncbi:DUF6665 family protein [Amorphus orientalis]|uniref:Uncharacterized protein n=1 Tax=Amorphus orientalis TaxID=649198 RepID=A0AAE4AQJ1_9HYPH|nr:DUF6665 family protein [Amorphus orientalis]MDQ0314141.1 hypothetical protein [Amorphus orientalis]
MSVRPPKALAPKSQTTPVEEAINQEIRGEMAGTHGRLLRKLERGLAALAAFDADPARDDPAKRDALVAEAGEALWHIVVQRELMGLRRTKAFLDEYQVPGEVRLRMGMRTGRSGQPSGTRD